MASSRIKSVVPVGSKQWIGNERQQVVQFVDQEIEDFTFSARNEVEWLNEHMAEIFSKNQLNFTEIFKTPGKFRGKTPRAARTQFPSEARAPLTTVFSTNARVNTNVTRSNHGDEVGATLQPREDAKVTLKTVAGARNNSQKTIDSGYHGMTEDEMDVEAPSETVYPVHTRQETRTEPELIILDAPASASRSECVEKAEDAEEHRTTEGSFHSAQESLINHNSSAAGPQVVKIAQEGLQDDQAVGRIKSKAESLSKEVMAMPLKTPDVVERNPKKYSLLEEDHEMDASHTPSQASSPVKPLVRKSSLTFASLPARAPLGAKKSIGTQAPRTSHVDQPKSTTIGGTYFGRFNDSKSFGKTRQQNEFDEPEEEDPMELDNEDIREPHPEESDGDTKITKLHNKSSTQRLHERINLLGQTQPARPTKSIPAIAPTYPDLSTYMEVDAPSKGREVTQGSVPTTTKAADDEDDWIQPPTRSVPNFSRPQLAKSRSIDVMEEIDGKDSIGGGSLGINKGDMAPPKDLSPVPSRVSKQSKPNNLNPAVLSKPLLPTNPSEQHDASHKKTVSVSNPVIQPPQTTTPLGSPGPKLHFEGPVSASKSKLQSIMKSARGLFTSSAGASAKAKIETLSPASSMKLRSQARQEAADLGAKPQFGQHGLSQITYSDLKIHAQAAVHTSPPHKNEVRKTRSSTEKEQRRNEKEEKERRRLENELTHARERESQKAAKVKEHQLPTKTVESLMKNGTAASVAPQKLRTGRPSPRGPKKQDACQSAAEDLHNNAEALEETGMAHQPVAPPSSRPQPQVPKPKDSRRPVRPGKDALPKPKPQPVSIRVGTLSQRVPFTNAALSSTLQESLSAAPAKSAVVSNKTSSGSLQTSMSSSSFKTSVSSVVPKPKVFRAADRKREQDEREAQRKLEQKREMERKRAVLQEEGQRREQQRRQEAERQREKERPAVIEDPKKMAQKQAIEKRRLELSKKEQQRDLHRTTNDVAHGMQQDKAQVPVPSYRPEIGGARPVSKFHPAPDGSRGPISHPPTNSAKPPIKRVFEPDRDDEPGRPTRAQGGQTFQPNEQKRRRTEDEETFEPPCRPTMAPPIRQSNIRKDGAKASIFGNPYLPTTSHGAGPSLLKSTMINQGYQHYPNHGPATRAGHPMDMAKYTNGKIPFAEAPNPPSQQTYKTPLPSSNKPAMATAPESSPIPNGDNYQLEDIATDSDDDDSEDERIRKQNRPDWVLTPNLEDRLREQERFNSDVVFGPVAPLNMEEMFKDKNRHHRFRSRTSSANWFGQDRLTEEEIRMDVAAREKMSREGGWTFGLS